MIYYFRFDRFKWIAKYQSTKTPGCLKIAFYQDLPQYGKKLISVSEQNYRFDNEIYVYRKLGLLGEIVSWQRM